MNLDQSKLTKSEWNGIEVPSSDKEKAILELIKQGYHNVNIKYNDFQSLMSYLKIEHTPEMEDHLYNLYFAKKIKDLKKKHDCVEISVEVSSSPDIKKADLIRLQKNDPAKMNPEHAFEYLLIHEVKSVLKYKNSDRKHKWLNHYFTLFKLIRNSISKINRHVLEIVNRVLAKFEDEIDIREVIENSVEFIEKNLTLLKYEDMMLYKHQKDIFTIMKTPGAKLAFYIAPTGTGKTLTPIGLSESNRIIFVCAARHVGLALAKAAITMNKKIAFAFGCASADDIRLHYFAAKDYTVNRRSGGIGKVDNSVGDKVEIMICDLKSYLPAMYYMLAFNKKENIISYWDEPTITLDYETHDLHKVIQNNWSNNLIENMILCSATLPKLHEIPETVGDFKNKFPGAQIHNIVSNDCKKSIPLINKNGYVVLPHYLNEDYDKVLEIVGHCENNLTLLRYFDLGEVVKFIIHVEKNNVIPNNMKISRRFSGLEEITMERIKMHYLEVLKKITGGTWGGVCVSMKSSRTKRIMPNERVESSGALARKSVSIGPGATLNSSSISSISGGGELIRMKSEQIVAPVKNVEEGNCAIYVTTKDAYSLTDGPTIFLASDVNKVAKFCIQQANIPQLVMDDIMEKIDFNNSLNMKIAKLENDLTDITERNSKMKAEGSSSSKKKDSDKSKKIVKEKKDDKVDVGVDKITSELNMLQSMIKNAELNETFIPNKQLHIRKWAFDVDSSHSFTSDIDETTVLDIMAIKDVENSWKILLLMGIGVFSSHTSISYTEIMKKLAEQQKLYLIIASSDYIYGTNYQFCHGYLSKDLVLTQEKIIQAFGRIGRNNIQLDYSIRLRDDEHINKLFYPELDKPEVRNMNKLFKTMPSEETTVTSNIKETVISFDTVPDLESECYEGTDSDCERERWEQGKEDIRARAFGK
jgi:hypothetical protein